MPLKDCLFNIMSCNQASTCYLKHLCKSIGVVIDGVKPSVILSIPNEVYLKLKSHREIVTISLLKTSTKTKVFCYNEKALENVLKTPRIKHFLTTIGYQGLTPRRVISELLIKLKHNQSFPHEIGIFLGYPLKDVMGFMGIIPLKAVDHLGWHVYGNPSQSLAVYKKIKASEYKINQVLKTLKI
jgi:hypothetical protein